MNTIQSYPAKKFLIERKFTPTDTNKIDRGSLVLPQITTEPISTVEQYIRFVATVLQFDKNTTAIYLYMALECYKTRSQSFIFKADKYRAYHKKSGSTALHSIKTPSVSTIYSCLRALYFVRAIWPTTTAQVFWANSLFFEPQDTFNVKLIYMQSNRI